MVQLVRVFQVLLCFLGSQEHPEVQIGLSALVVLKVLVVPVVLENLEFPELLQVLVVL